jgi:hypothetical protein
MEIPFQHDGYIWANYSVSCYLNWNSACPIIARSQCWLFALSQGKYPYLPSHIRICPQIFVFTLEFNVRYLRCGLKENMSKYKERWYILHWPFILQKRSLNGQIAKPLFNLQIFLFRVWFQKYTKQCRSVQWH